MSDFVHLHVHTEYSLLDGASKLDALLDRVHSLGQHAVAITDHGVMYGVAEFYKKAVERGIKPIIGCEMYVTTRSRLQKEHTLDSKYGHLILLAKNNVGYHNLIKLVSDSFINGYYYKPRTDIEQLSLHSEGIIALSGCFAGDIQRLILSNEFDKAREKALQYKKIFSDNFYLELQDHGLEFDNKIINNLTKISLELNIPLVATNDCHYVLKSDAYLQKVLMCISMNKSINEENNLAFQTDEFYLKSSDEMKELFSHIENAIENTVKISDECNVTLDFNSLHLPVFDKSKTDSYDLLCKQCYDGLKSRYENYKVHIERLEYELSVIKQMKFVDYFLIVSDFVNFAKTNHIAVGPGRGSATGSLVSYCLGITDIDPIKYGLIFERFLNPSRVSMPDIDIDFCVERRHEVMDYLINKYGVESVSQIITFGTLAARAAIKDVGRVLEIPFSTVESVCKHFPFKPGITIESVLKKDEDLQNRYRNNDVIRKLIDTAMMVEGFPRHGSTHAAGVVITEGPVDDYIPLAKNDDVVVTQFQKNEVEQLGLLKIDLLGLRNITVIDKTVKQISQLEPEFDINKIPYDDSKTFEMISKGNTFGVFQLESPGMRKLLTNLQPSCIDDIIAAVSLYRPGPMDSIPIYLENKKNPDKIKYLTNELKPILADTFGCIVYQEQVMQIAREIAGYSYGHADILRAAMSKKKTDIMENERKLFIDGAVKNNIKKNVAIDIFEKMSEFARYGFNKSHAAGYAVIAYRTAYLKANYPALFMSSLLSSVMYNSAKIKEYFDECTRMGLTVCSPDINKSRYQFEAAGNKIYYGLGAVKNVGKKFIKSIDEEQDNNGDFTSYIDFLERMSENDLNRRAIESLVKCGAFDSFGYSRRHMLSVYDKILNDVTLSKKDVGLNQMSLFDDIDVNYISNDYFENPLEEFDITKKLMYEKESLGLYISEHPMIRYNTVYKSGKYILSSDINSDKLNDKNVKIFGIIDSIRIVSTKQLRDMAYMTIDDIKGSIEVIIFPRQFEIYKTKLDIGTLVIIEGELSPKNDTNQIICSKIEFPNRDKLLEEFKKLYLNIASINSEEYSRTIQLLKKFPGNISCVLHFKDNDKTLTTGDKLKIKPDYTLINQLEMLLGKENIVIK